MIDPDLSYVPKKFKKIPIKFKKNPKKIKQTMHVKEVFFFVGWNGYHFFLYLILHDN